jgi:N-methylhydantoinase A
VQVASSVIVKAIRAISVERGHDPSKFSLFAFGGAGPLHAIDVAKDLGINRVFIPPNPGILCAEGLLGSDLVADLIQPSLAVFDQNIFEVLNVAKSNLSMRANDWFAAESVDAKDQRQTWSADLRYAGQNFELAINFKNDQFNRDTALALRAEFDKAHEVAYGYSQSNEPVELVGMRVKLAGILSKPPLPKTKAGSGLKSIGSRSVSFGKNIWTETPIYRREAIPVEQNFEGPAVIEQMDSMLLIFPGDTAKIDGWGNLIIDLGQAED